MEEQFQKTTQFAMGAQAKRNGEKLKNNPYPGGSTAWFNWHNGYKAAESLMQRQFRRAQRGYSVSVPDRKTVFSKRG